MIKNLANWIINNRIQVIIATLIIVAGGISGIRFLEFTTDYRAFFSEENPQLKAFENLQRTYTRDDDNILFVLLPKDGKVFTRNILESIEELTASAWKIPYSIRVDSITNFQYSYANGDDMVVRDLIKNAEQLSDKELNVIKKVALNEPLLVNRLLSSEAHATSINIVLKLPGKKTASEVPKAIAYARNLASEFSVKHPDTEIYLTGIAVMNNSFPEVSQHDIQVLTPIMYLVIIIILVLLLRSVSSVFVAVLVVGMSIFVAMGITGWIGLNLTPPSAVAPTIILTIALADCIHLLSNFLQGINNGKNKILAMIESLRINFQPIFITSITTAIGFLSMNFSDAPPFRDLGNIVAIGVGVAFLLSVFFLPAVVTLLPIQARHLQTQNKTTIIEKFANVVLQRRKTLLFGNVCIIFCLVIFIPYNEINDDFVKNFDESVPFRKATDIAVKHLSGIYTIEYSLNSGESGGISNPQYLTKIDDFAKWYQQQPEVMHVNVITDVIKRINMNLHSDDPNYYRIPIQRNLAAQCLLLYEMSLPLGLDLNNRINMDKSSTRFTVTLHNLTTKELLALEKRAQRWLRENAPLSMQVNGISQALMFAHIGERNVRSMLIGSTLALVLISLLLIISFRSLKIGMISMIPNLIPIAMAFGLWGIFVGQINMALATVIGVTLGIVVDDTVHFLSKYLRARRENEMSPRDAVHYAFSKVGTALVVTTVVLSGGFIVLATSSFELNASMGLVSTITFILALIVDFLFLPSLLTTIERK